MPDKLKKIVNKKDFENKIQERFLLTETKAIDSANRTIELSFSSEQPVERWFGMEILDHSIESVDLSRVNNSAAVLWNHNSDKQIGVVEKVWLEDRRLKAVIRFSKNEDGEKILADIVDGIIRNVSFGYMLNELRLESEVNELKTYRVTKWMPYEVSMVSIPADHTVGVGRSLDPDAKQPVIEPEIKSEPVTEPEQKTEPVIEPEVKSEPAVEPVQQKIIIKKNGDKKIMDEETRKKEISAIAERHGVDATFALEAGLTVEQFRSLVLSQKEKTKPVAFKPTVELTEKEQKDYSIFGAMRALVFGEKNNESEISDELTKKTGRAFKGIGVPHEALARFINLRRDLTAGGTGTGAEWVTKQYPKFIEALTESMFLAEYGLNILPSNGLGTFSLPKMSAGSTFGWAATETAALAESTPTTAQVELTPKRGGTYVDISKTLIKSSSFGPQQRVVKNLLDVIGEGLCTAVLQGSGSSGQPTGIVNTTSVNPITGTGFTYAKVFQYIQAILESKYMRDDIAFFMIPEIWAALSTLEKISGQNGFVIENGKIGAWAVRPTNLLAHATKKYIVAGPMSQVDLALFDGIDLTLDNLTQATSGLIRVVAEQYADVAVERPSAFSVSDGFSIV